MEPTIIFDNVGKKFNRGYVSDSLRDTIAAPFKRFFSKNGNPGSTGIYKQKNDEFWALKGVDFEVKPGEALGIIGPNGSGKSTTLKLLSRILKPDEGVITVKGRAGALIELGAGFHSDLTGRENVFLNASILGMSKEEIERKYDEIVDFAGLSEFMDTPVKWYSSGMYARLGFSVAIHISPEILLIDEVLSVGDIGFQKKCMDKMISYKENGVTIIFVSHNMAAVSALCDNVIVIDHGKVAYMSSPHESISYYTRNVIGGNDDGNEPVRLIKSEVYDSNRKKKENYKCGEKARIKIIMQSRENLQNISVGLKLTTTEGMLVSRVQSDTFSVNIDSLSLKINEKVFFELQLTLNLAPGEYDCFAYVYDKKKGRPVYSKRFTQIIIEGESRALGVAYLEPELIDLLKE